MPVTPILQSRGYSAHYHCKTTKKCFNRVFISLLLAFVSTVSPKIVEISSDISINEGSNISLTCIATGRPEPTVTWRHISPKAVGFVSEDEYLEIQGITREQSGDYECSASNDVAAPVVRRVKVTVNCEWSPEPPVWPRGRPMAWPRNAPDYRASCRLRVRDNGVALSVLCF